MEQEIKPKIGLRFTHKRFGPGVIIGFPLNGDYVQVKFYDSIQLFIASDFRLSMKNEEGKESTVNISSSEQLDMQEP